MAAEYRDEITVGQQLFRGEFQPFPLDFTALLNEPHHARR
ncbi:MAG: hypothetical protein JWR17_599 [Pseudomonas sp.]|jgi:hypothetical protein|nr:hypothetical protein [Pseudomonas sp.]